MIACIRRSRHYTLYIQIRIAQIVPEVRLAQAGAILWFADVTATVLVMGSAQASEGMKGFPLAITLCANFLGNQQAGSFKAVASFVKRGRTVSVVRTMVYGASEKLIADVTTSHVLAK